MHSSVHHKRPKGKGLRYFYANPEARRGLLPFWQSGLGTRAAVQLLNEDVPWYNRRVYPSHSSML